MKTYYGFLYAKLELMGSKKETSIYFLQEKNTDKEYVLTTKNPQEYGPNLILDPFVNHKIKIEGEIDGKFGKIRDQDSANAKKIKADIIIVSEITDWD